MNGNGLTLRELVYDLLDESRRAGDFPLARDSIDLIAAGMIDTLNDQAAILRVTQRAADRLQVPTMSRSLAYCGAPARCSATASIVTPRRFEDRVTAGTDRCAGRRTNRRPYRPSHRGRTARRSLRGR